MSTIRKTFVDETLHEINEDRDVQRTLVELEPHEAAIAHGGDHTRRELLSRLRQDRRLSFWRVTFAPPGRALPAPRLTDNPAYTVQAADLRQIADAAQPLYDTLDDRQRHRLVQFVREDLRANVMDDRHDDRRH